MNTININQQNRISTLNINSNPVRQNPQVQQPISFKSNKLERISHVMSKELFDVMHSSPADIYTRLKFRKFLDESLPYIMQPENFINSGRESKVYRIDDKYVAKIKRGKYDTDAIHFYNGVTTPSSRFSHLDFYYGEPLVRVGNVEILKNVSGTTDTVTCGLKISRHGDKTHDKIREFQDSFLPYCAELPQETYDNFARNLKELNDISSLEISLGKKEVIPYILNPDFESFPENFKAFQHRPIKRFSYIPDIVNPNNLIIADNQIRLVDSFEKTLVKEPNTLYMMLEPLLLRVAPETYALEDPALNGARKEILKKCLIAGEKNNLPIENCLKDRNADWTLGCIMKNIDLSGVPRRVQEMRQKGMPLAQRIENIEEMLRE